MPDSPTLTPQPQPGSAPTPPSSAPLAGPAPASAAAAEPARSLYSAGLRFADSDPVPAELVGKTPREMLDLYMQMRSLALTNANAPAQPVPAPVPADSFDPESVLTDPARFASDFERRINAGVEQYVTRLAQPMVASMAESARFASQSDPKWRDTWTRFGSEVEREIEGVPLHMRTKAVYDRAAQLVRAAHVEEIAREMAQSFASQPAPASEPSDGGTADPAPSGDPIATLWAEGGAYVEFAKSQQMTLQTLRDYVRSRHLDPAKFVERARKFAPGRTMIHRDNTTSYV